MTIIDIDATSALEMLRGKKLSVGELLDDVISHIEQNDRYINAVVVRDFTRARETAAELEKAPEERRGRTFGLPITVKESFDVSTLPTTWGLPELVGSAAERNSAAVEKVVQAGCVVVGKTNVPRLLSGLGSANDVYGRTLNPLHADWSPGGSSSGSAAAVRAGFSYLDIASDLSGSIRHPAAFCGLFGHSPSNGLVALRGHALFGRLAPLDMSTPGPIARSARDLVLALNVLAGPDIDIRSAVTARLPNARHGNLSDYRLLVVTRHPMIATEPEVSAAVLGFARGLASRGARLVDGDRVVPDLAEATRNYMRLLGAALSIGQDDEARAAFQTALDGLSEDEVSMEAEFIRGSLSTHARWLDSNEKRIALRWRWREIFREFDAVICPACPVSHLTHAQAAAANIEVDGIETRVDDLVVWATVSKAADLPSTVLPLTDATAGVPSAVQIIAPFMEDLTSIDLAGLAARNDISPVYSKVIFPPYR